MFSCRGIDYFISINEPKKLSRYRDFRVVAYLALLWLKSELEPRRWGSYPSIWAPKDVQESTLLMITFLIKSPRYPFKCSCSSWLHPWSNWKHSWYFFTVHWHCAFILSFNLFSLHKSKVLLVLSFSFSPNPKFWPKNKLRIKQLRWQQMLLNYFHSHCDKLFSVL